MRSFVRSAVITLPLALLAAGSGATPAAAQDVKGFFSRFLPGGDPTPVPATSPAPTTPAPRVEMPEEPTETSPFNNHRGGLIDAMRGAPVGGCQGTLCSFMGGESAVRPMQGVPPAAPGAPVAPPEATVATVRSRPLVDDRVSPRKERCTAPVNDPWRCYR